MARRFLFLGSFVGLDLSYLVMGGAAAKMDSIFGQSLLDFTSLSLFDLALHHPFQEQPQPQHLQRPTYPIGSAFFFHFFWHYY